MFNTHGITRDACQRFGKQAGCGYDRRHSFTGRHAVTGEEKVFFVESFSLQPQGCKV